MSTDSTVLISKYLKEYNHIYKEANEIYHEAARMPKQTVNSSIRKLQTDGYLTLSPGKGRSMHIHLTASGKKLIQEKLLPLIQIENDTLASFSPEECEQLLRLNAKYNQTLRSRLSNLEEDL